MMKDKEIVAINGVDYKYCSYYKRLGLHDDGDGSVQHPAVACPECHGTKFSITYGSYKCIANCECGNSMTIYDG